jgi:hypothetical protein
MKNFIITSKVQSIKTLQYNVEADSLEEAIEQVKRGIVDYEEIDEDFDWSTEAKFGGWEDRDE